MEAIKTIYPSEQHLVAFFAPCKWEGALANPDKCTLYPNAKLSLLDEYYMTGMGKVLVINNMLGLFSLIRPNEPVNRHAVEETAKLFVGKYGKTLSLFGLLYYFANYITDYKNSYGQFDLMDVLRQCGKAFMPWWTARVTQEKRREDEETAFEETGFAALCKILRREYVAKGRDIRTSNICRLGDFTEEELHFIESGEEMGF